MWLRKTHELLATHIPPEDMVRIAKTKMLKVANEWITSEMEVRGHVMSWDVFEDRFRRRIFTMPSQRLMIRKFMDFTHEGKFVTNYSYEFEMYSKYAKKIVPDEESRLEQYIEELSGQLRSYVRACGPATIFEAHEHAMQYKTDNGGPKETRARGQKRPPVR